MILTPDGKAPEINRTVTASGSACPRDPFHYQRGEAGYYHDTQLGDTPNDFELAPSYGYTPVHEGWTVTNQGLVPGGLTLGESLPSAYPPPPESEESVYRKRAFAIQVITGFAIVASAAFGIRRALQDEASVRRHVRDTSAHRRR
jgi:hypothetical protein